MNYRLLFWQGYQDLNPDQWFWRPLLYQLSYPPISKQNYLEILFCFFVQSVFFTKLAVFVEF